MVPGAKVKVLEPFTADFPGIYVVDVVTQADDGQLIVVLVDVVPAFDPKYLEEVIDGDPGGQ